MQIRRPSSYALISCAVVCACAHEPIATWPADYGGFPPPAEEQFVQDVAWSPDGRSLAFSLHPGGAKFDATRWEIGIVQQDGSGRRTLVQNAQSPSWSPDGRRLVYSSPASGNAELWIVDADGANARQLTHDPAADRQPAWSPRGDRIAFVREAGGDAELYVVAPDGSGLARLTHDPAADLTPQWSPDGSEIVFGRSSGGGHDQVRVVAVDGSAGRAITAEGGHAFFPSFLPDGRVAYTSLEEGERRWLYVAGRDGSAPQRLAHFELFLARWSPAGGAIAFLAGKWPRSALYVMDAEGKGPRKLVN